jgi:hypothetical protein
MGEVEVDFDYPFDLFPEFEETEREEMEKAFKTIRRVEGNPGQVIALLPQDSAKWDKFVDALPTGCRLVVRPAVVVD